MSARDQLLYRLEVYLNKLYKRKALVGLVYWLLTVSLEIIIFSGSEYLGWFSTTFRFFLFCSFLFVSTFLAYIWVLSPFLKKYGILKRKNLLGLAQDLEKEFPELDDRLFNTLELLRIEDNDLVQASIEQKAKYFNQLNLQKKVNKVLWFRLLFFSIGIVSIYILSFLSTTNFIAKGSKRIINYNSYYDKYSHVTVDVISNLSINRNSDLNLEVTISGLDTLSPVFLIIGNSNFLLDKNEKGNYVYKFKNVNNSFTFKFSSQDYFSRVYEVNIIDVPILLNSRVSLSYPKYTGLKHEEIDNIFDFVVPEGTHIQWYIDAKHTDSLYYINENSRAIFVKKGRELSYSTKIYKNTLYSLKGENKNIQQVFVKNKSIVVQKDLFPFIHVEPTVDKQNLQVVHYRINLSDDYGLSQLNFISETDTVVLPINKRLTEQSVYFSFDGTSVLDSLSYFFRVYDNDGIHGPKYTDSKMQFFYKPTLSEKIESDLSSLQEFDKNVTEINNLTHSLREDIEQLRKDLLNTNLKDWEKERKLEELAQKQADINSLMKSLSELNQSQNSYNQLATQNEINAKQQEIEQALNAIMNEELKSLLEQISELQNKLKDKDLQTPLNQLDFSYDKIEKELDRNLALIKRFKLEENLSDYAQALDKLSKKQASFMKDTSEHDANHNFNQEELSKLQDVLQDLNSVNKELKEPYNLDNITDSLQKLTQKVDKQEINFEETEQELESLAEELRSQMQETTAEQEGENADNLRLLLENLFYVSFEEESLRNRTQGTSTRNPIYPELAIMQTKLQDDFSIISDSLHALSKRTKLLGNHIAQTNYNILDNFKKVNSAFMDYNTGRTVRFQQELLQNINELLLLLTESLKNMDSAASGSGSGQQSSKRPQKPNKGQEEGEGQPSLQESLEKMLQQLQQGMNGKSLGELGQLLAEQEMLQQLLQEMMNQGSTNAQYMKQMQDIQRLMEQNKRDIVQMNISSRTVNRNQEILTRLLEAENAEEERETDEKREAQTAIFIKPEDPNIYFEENGENINFNENLRGLNLQLKAYYKRVYDNYLININATENE